MIVTMDNIEGLVKSNLVRVAIETQLEGINHKSLIESVDTCKENLLKDYPEVIGMEHYDRDFVVTVHKSILDTLTTHLGYVPNKVNINKTFEYLINKHHNYKILCLSMVNLMEELKISPEPCQNILRQLLEDSDVDDPDYELLNILETKCVGFSTREECVKFASELIRQGYAYGVLIYETQDDENIYDGCVVEWED